MTKPNNYGLPISLILHLIIFAIPVSMAVSTKHFKKIELFVIDERPVQTEQEKAIQPKHRKVTQEIVKEMPPQPENREIEVKELPVLTEVPVSNVVEPVIISKIVDVAPLTPVPQIAPSVSPPTMKVDPKPLLDIEFGSVNAPQFLHREMPIYPLMARRLGREGKVLLRLTIDENGRLLNIEVIKGAGFGFTEAAIEAVKKSTFQPAMHDGIPVMSKALLPIRFSLRRD